MPSYTNEFLLWRCIYIVLSLLINRQYGFYSIEFLLICILLNISSLVSLQIYVVHLNRITFCLRSLDVEIIVTIKFI